MNRSWNILNWNVRGINSTARWNDIRRKIDESACNIITLQETKRELFDTSYIRKFCPKNISKFEFLPSIGASGGLLIAWNDNLFTGQLEHHNDFSLTIKFTCKLSGTVWKLTNIYGPCQQDARLVLDDKPASQLRDAATTSARTESRMPQAAIRSDHRVLNG